MNLRLALLDRLDELRNSYWFVPGLMAVGAVLVSLGTLHLDVQLSRDSLGEGWWVYTGSASGARAVLQTIGTSMIGVAGVVFSITIVTLTLAANKFGPRIFRNFMTDTGNQVVLGLFTSTFLFCLVVLRQVRGSDNASDLDRFIPQVSLLVAVGLAVCCLGVLIYFIHHVAASIQTANVVAAVGRDLLAGIRDLYPEQIGDAPGLEERAEFAEQVPSEFEAEAVPVCAVSGGYIRLVEADNLLRQAAEKNLVVRLERHPGDFVASGDVVLRAWPADRLATAVADGLRSAIAIGSQRTPAQDVRFPLGQLTEVACLALSSGVNDLYTAVLCVDRLGEGLALLAERSIPSPYRADENGTLRVITRSFDLPALLAASFEPIRQGAAQHPLVMVSLLEALARIADRTHRTDDRGAVREYAEAVRVQAAVSGPSAKGVEGAFERVMRTLDTGGEYREPW